VNYDSLLFSEEFFREFADRRFSPSSAGVF